MDSTGAGVINMGCLLVQDNSGGQMNEIKGKGGKARKCNHSGSLQSGLRMQLLLMQLSLFQSGLLLTFESQSWYFIGKDHLCPHFIVICICCDED